MEMVSSYLFTEKIIMYLLNTKIENENEKKRKKI